jgi:DNA polymerase
VSADTIDYFRNDINQLETDDLKILYGDNLKPYLTSSIRSTIEAPPGYHLAVADFTSIESVVLAWCAKCEKILNIYRNKQDAYKDFATRLFNIDYENVTKQQRSVAKPAVLGAGYGVGARGLAAYAQGMGIPMTEEEAQRHVSIFRQSYPEIVELWHKVEEYALESVTSNGEWAGGEASQIFKCDKRFLRLTLPSGRDLHYYKPRLELREKFGKERYCLTYEGKNTRLETYGSKLVENIVQALSRDVLVNALKNVDKNCPDLEIVGHVHDEIICLVPDSVTDSVEQLESQMVAPKWCEGAPIRAEGYKAKYYRKD